MSESEYTKRGRRPPEPTVAAGIAKAILDLAVSKSADQEELLRRANLNAVLLDNQDARVPLTSYRALIRSGKELANDPALALHYGECVDLSDVSVVGLISQASDTMGHCFLQLQRYARLMIELDSGSAARFELVPREDGVWLVDNRWFPNEFFEHTEIAFSQMVCNSRFFGVDPFAKAVRVTHGDPGYANEYERVLGAPVQFCAEENAMLLQPGVMSRPIGRQGKYVFGILSEHADRLLQSLKSMNSTRSRVESALMPVLHTGNASVELVATQMGVSRQTLYRKLKEEGLTFQQVLSSLRMKLALQYLQGNKVSVHQIAYLVGFSDPGTFSRAFKRLTGRTAREVREELTRS